jgi:hypothetical protein
MNTNNQSGFKTFTSTNAIERGVFVKRSSGEVVICGADEASIGVTTTSASAGAEVTVQLFTAPGTFLVQAGGVVADDATVYTDASGKATSTGTTNVVGTALEASTAADQFIEILPAVV